MEKIKRPRNEPAREPIPLSHCGDCRLKPAAQMPQQVRLFSSDSTRNVLEGQRFRRNSPLAGQLSDQGRASLIKGSQVVQQPDLLYEKAVEFLQGQRLEARVLSRQQFKQSSSAILYPLQQVDQFADEARWWR